MNPNHVAFTGTVPKNYEKYLGPYLFEPYAKDLIGHIDHPAEAVLELACGTGRVTRHLRQHFPAATRLVATDLNPDMLTIARQLISGENMEWQVADMQALPFDDHTFDLVVCQFGFMFVPDKPLAFGEVYRVLRPGGRLLFNTWDKLAYNQTSDLTNQVVAQFFPDSPPNFFNIPFSMHDQHQIRSWLENAGFQDISVELIAKQSVGESPEAIARGLLLGTPLYPIIQERRPDLLPRIIEAASKAIGERFGFESPASRMQAWVAQGVKQEE
ncbi:methyltransferase domain-containing protein [Nibrella viscosa]|uniref:Methyltransferase domain-containing protein n=1 Tax=Nibrella viscosa TaxID=1084524 RepID=A0ABP8KR53_9BACT